MLAAFLFSISLNITVGGKAITFCQNKTETEMFTAFSSEIGCASCISDARRLRLDKKEPAIFVLRRTTWNGFEQPEAWRTAQEGGSIGGPKIVGSQNGLSMNGKGRSRAFNLVAL